MIGSISMMLFNALACTGVAIFCGMEGNWGGVVLLAWPAVLMWTGAGIFTAHVFDRKRDGRTWREALR